jgi:hypothetical protein
MLREQAIEANPVLLDTQLVNPKLFAGKLVVCRLGKCAAAAKALRAAQASALGALGIKIPLVRESNSVGTYCIAEFSGILQAHVKCLVISVDTFSGQSPKSRLVSTPPHLQTLVYMHTADLQEHVEEAR